MQQGLAHAIVFRAFQDKRGFLWFCTNYGLSRFDGKGFRNYYTKDGLGNNCIMSASQFGDASMLVCTYGGGISVVTDSGIYPLRYNKEALPGRVLYATQFKDKIWITSPHIKTLYCREPDGTLRNIDIKSVNGISIRFDKILQMPNGLFLTSDAGIFHIDEKGNVLPFLDKIVHERVTDIKLDHNGGYWIGVTGRILHVSGQTIKKTFRLDSASSISNILVDKDNNTWITSSLEGFMLIQNDSLHHVSSCFNIHKIIINDLFCDNEGDIWIATHGEGVYKLNSLDVVNYPIREGLVKNSCKAIAKGGDGELYIGSMGTVGVYRDNSITPLAVKTLGPTQFIYFIQYENDRIYIGTPRGMIVKQSRPPFAEQLITAAPETPNGVISFLKDGDSILWLGSYSGVYRIAANTSLMRDSDRVIDNVRCNVIYRDGRGVIWFGTETGAIAYENGNFRNVVLSAAKPTNIINAIFEDSRDRLWFATDSGLVCKEKDRYRTFTTINGLTHDKCNTIVEDNSHILWIGTTNGLSTIDVATLDLNEYRTDIYPDEVLSLYSHDSTLFVGTIDGFSVIRISRDIANAPPPLYITAIKTQDSVVNMPRSIQLPFRNNKLLISFIGLSYRYPDMVEYRYKINELDKHWHITSNNEIELSALPPGDYTFVLSARKNKGAWGNAFTLPINIETPLWRTTWFILFIFLFLLVFIFFITRWYTVKRETKKRQQLSVFNKITYLRQQALSALINPHFIFNCLNSIQHYIFKRDHYKANIYLADFAQLIRMTMEHAQEVFISLEKELSRINLYLTLEQLRFGDGLEFEIDVDSTLNAGNIRIPNMIIQPYVENAVWHGIMPLEGKGKIRISVTQYDDQKIMIAISDNGVGMDHTKNEAKAQRTSYGMRLTEERLALLKKLLGQYYSVQVRSRDGGGTVVELLLPIEADEETLKWMDDVYD